MKIADVSIKQPVFITMVIALIVVLGVVSYNRLSVDLMPEITFPIVAITVVNPGVGPEEMESQVTKPIEDIVSSVNGLKKVTSTTAESITVIAAEFKLEVDPKRAADDVREKIASIRNSLPREIQEPIIDKYDPSAAPIISYTVTSQGGKVPLLELRKMVEDRIKTQLDRIDGVGSVSILGGLQREIQVKVDLQKLNSLNLSIAQVSQSIRAENLNLPAGRVTQKDYDFLIRTNAELEKVAELNDLVVATPGNIPVHLQDVATVVDGFKIKQTISRINGLECISLVIRKQSGTNTVRIADNIQKLMKRIQQRYPDLKIQVANDESLSIKESRDDVLKSLIEGALLAGLVVLLSFGDLRNTIITIAGLPVCIIGTFAVMNLFGFSVNVITLLGMSLSVGLLIDDAIVVRENIFRHMEKLGKSPKVAASDGTSEVGLAVMATTLTIVSVFLPVAFATGIVGKFLKQFGITVAAAVLISLFEAFTFAPMLSAYFFKKTEKKTSASLAGRFQGAVSGFYDRLGNNYRPLLKWSLNHRKTVIAITAAIFLISAYLFTLVGTGGMPQGQRPEFTLAIQCASGSSLESTEKTVRLIENILYKQKEIKSLFTVIGSESGAADEASINVKLNVTRRTKEYQDHLRPLLAAIPGVTITFQDTFSIGGAAASSLRQQPIQINLKSNNLKSLVRTAETVKSGLAGVPGLVDLNSDYRNPKPEIQIVVDRQRAARMGVSTMQVAAMMRSFIDGDIASKFRAGQDLVDIRVKLADEWRNDLDRLGRAFIPTMRGASISLDQVARFKVVNGPTQIKRSERTRQVIIGSNILQGTALNEIQNKVVAKLNSLDLPADVTFDFGGQVERVAESFSSLFVALILAVVFVYMILASQFGSFTQPFALMLALPLAIIGAVLGLLMANKLFDMVAFIGLIMLMGLVAKNSILLIDFTNVLRRRGQNREQAIIEAGSIRLRPILMTTLAMILGMIPVAFSLGSSSNFRAAIGITIIGGLISSTLLTLIIVPVVYAILDDFTGRFRKKAG